MQVQVADGRGLGGEDVIGGKRRREKGENGKEG